MPENRGLAPATIRIILEPTSGNTGIALAMIGPAQGLPGSRLFHAPLTTVTNEAAPDCRALGADVHRLPGVAGANGRSRGQAPLVSKDERFVMPYHYGNPANPALTTNDRARSCPTARDRRLRRRLGTR